MKPEIRSQNGQQYYVMSKKYVEDKIINNMRFTDHREKYFWKNDQLWRKTKEPNMFGRGFLSIEEPIFLQWRGKPVQVVGNSR